MDNKIEIFDNTLLKLLVRRGSDADRQNIVLSQGEVGYTTDTNRLFVGDGINKGGTVVGNKYAGSRTDVTTITNVVSGDYAFDSDSNQLYIYKGGSPENIGNWTSIGGVYTAGDGSIIVSPTTNKITIGALSANSFNKDALGDSIIIDDSGRITLDRTIKTNSITSKDTTFLKLQSNLKINNVEYNWPSYTGSNLFLKSDISGNLTWSEASAPISVFVAGAASQIPVGSIMSYVSSANAPYGWLLCNGNQVPGTLYRELSAVIGTTYGGTATDFNLPDFTNKTLYGVRSNPAGSTIYSLASGVSGTSSGLSAYGVLYIIKAKPDSLVTSNITYNDGLSSTVNGIDITGSAVSPLTGSIKVGLKKIISGQEVIGGASFTINDYGCVTNISTQTTHPAGEILTVGPRATPAYNSYSPISFLQTPVTIFTGTPGLLRFTLSAYPSITNSGGTATAYSVPQNAKNLIVDCDIQKSGPDSGNQDRYVVSAPNINLLNNSGSAIVDTNEYLIASSRASGSGDSIRSASQVFIPLSANTAGSLQCGIRTSTSSGDTVTLRVIGYTL